MSGDIFVSIREDIHTIHNNIKGQLLVKAGHVGDYAHLEFSPMDSFIRPAVVLTVARLYNYRSPKVLSLGAIVQFIFMASQIHKQIPDTNVQSHTVDPKDGTQFPVLVGDYLYGKFFTNLCDAKLLQYLRPLADIIGHIHEGGILRKVNQNRLNNHLINEVTRLEVAELLAGAATIAGNLAGASQEDQMLLNEYGHNLGMLFGLSQRNSYDRQILLTYYNQAKSVLEKLPNYPEKILLEQILQTLWQNDQTVRKVV
ncbi:polyprenyl synthetase family protein [Desulfotomaculum defluvii]